MILIFKCHKDLKVVKMLISITEYVPLDFSNHSDSSEGKHREALFR